MLDIWDNFVYNSRNGTLLHTQKFLSYHGKKSDEVDHSLLFKYNNETVAVFPAVYRFPKDCSADTLFSHQGSSFGGVVLGYNIGLEATDNIVQNIVDYAIENDFKVVAMRLPPRIYHKLPSDELDHSLLRNSFYVSAFDLSCVITLDHQIYLNETNARSTRKSHGLDLHIDWNSVEWEKYWDILKVNLSSKYNTKPTHTLDEILRLKNMFPQKIKLITCKAENTILCGIVIFITSDEVFEVFYIAQNYDFQEYRSLNFLLHSVINWGIDNHFKYMNLGLTTEDGGGTVNWGILKFKEGFGSHGVIRRTYRRDL
jgi:hypothetical protein